MFLRFGVSRPFDSLDTLVSSPVFSPSSLAIIRLIIAFYTLITLCFSLAWNCIVLKIGNSYFSYFTHLTYIGICAYFFASGIQTWIYARNGNKTYPLQTWARPLQLLHVLLLSSIVTLPFVVTIVYWGLLFPSESFPTKYDAWSAISMHALNAIFALFEVFFTNIPPMPWLALIINIVILAFYVAVAYITYQTQGFYVYSFLDPVKQKSKLAIYIVAIAVAECILFAIMQGLILARQRVTGLRGQTLTSSALPSSSSRDTEETLQEWEEVKVSKESYVLPALNN